MHPSQFAIACGASPEWVEEVGRALRPGLRYDPEEARHLGLVRHLQQAFRLSPQQADRLAAQALADPSWPEGAGRTTLDVRRYLSDYAVRLARAAAHQDPERRDDGRQEESAVERARRYGWDIGLLRSSLRSSPAERIRRLDENVEFVRALRTRAR